MAGAQQHGAGTDDDGVFAATFGVGPTRASLGRLQELSVPKPRAVPSPSNKYRDRVCKIIEMTGVYHTILKFPELDPDIYLTE